MHTIAQDLSVQSIAFPITSKDQRRIAWEIKAILSYLARHGTPYLKQIHLVYDSRLSDKSIEEIDQLYANELRKYIIKRLGPIRMGSGMPLLTKDYFDGATDAAKQQPTNDPDNQVPDQQSLQSRAYTLLTSHAFLIPTLVVGATVATIAGIYTWIKKRKKNKDYDNKSNTKKDDALFA